MKNTLSETGEITITISIAFKNFDFVVAAFGKAVAIRTIKRIENETISAVYPKTEIQQCVIHQIRNSTKYVSYKDIKALMADLKKAYGA